MTSFLKPHDEKIYAALRIVVGFMFLCHGLQKIFGLFGGAPSMPAPVLWTAGLIEFVGGSLVMVGFRANWAGFLCSGLMAVAYFMAHQSHGLLPIENKGELAALYSFVFLLIAVKGSGIWSVDASR